MTEECCQARDTQLPSHVNDYFRQHFGRAVGNPGAATGDRRRTGLQQNSMNIRKEGYIISFEFLWTEK